MPWQFCEVVKSPRTVECAACGTPIPAEEIKVRINPSREHEGRFRYYYHRTCFNSLVGPMIETLLKGA